MREKLGKFGEFYQITKLYFPTSYNSTTITSILMFRQTLFCQFFLHFHQTFQPFLLLNIFSILLYHIARKIGIKLAVWGLSTTKVKYIIYFELHQTIMYNQILTRQLLTKKFLSKPPNITTTTFPTTQYIKYIYIYLNVGNINITLPGSNGVGRMIRTPPSQQSSTLHACPANRVPTTSSTYVVCY